MPSPTGLPAMHQPVSVCHQCRSPHLQLLLGPSTVGRIGALTGEKQRADL